MSADTLPAHIRRALVAAADALDGAGVAWLVAGSVARALHGWAATPRDLDIEVAAADADAAAAALGTTAARVADARAHSRRAIASLDGTEVDITGGLALAGPEGVLPPDFPLMARHARTFTLDGRTVRAAPVEEQIVRVVVTGDEDRRLRLVREAPAGFVPDADYVGLRLDAARAAR